MTSELIELSAVISDIYDAAIEPALWQHALKSICAYVGGFSAALHWHDSEAEVGEVLYEVNADPVYSRLYFEKYLPMNPIFPAAAFTEAGVVHGVTDFISQKELERTRFYKEWLEPQGIVDAVGANLETGMVRSSLVHVRTDKSYGRVDERMRRRLGMLVPHLQRAVAIGRLFDRERSRNEALTALLDRVGAAVVLVGANGKITFANDHAKRMLGDAVLVQARDDALRLVAPEADTVLQDVVVAATKGEASIGARSIAVPLKGAALDRWFAYVLPLTSGRRRQAGQANDAVVAVFIRKTAPDTPSALETIARSYKLTATETRVLTALLQARGVRAMAALLGLSQNTVKTHLRNLFRKTGTQRQADLIRIATGY